MEVAKLFLYPTLIETIRQIYSRSMIPYGIMDASLYTVWHNEVMRRSCPVLRQLKGLFQLTGDLALEDILDEIEATGSFQIPSNPNDIFTSRGLVIGAIPETEYYFIQAFMAENCGNGIHPTGLEKTLCDFEGPIRKNLSAILSASFDAPEHAAIKESVYDILCTLTPALDFARLSNGLYPNRKIRVELTQFLGDFINAVRHLGYNKNLFVNIQKKPVYAVTDTLLLATIIGAILSEALLNMRKQGYVNFHADIFCNSLQVLVTVCNQTAANPDHTLSAQPPDKIKMSVALAAASFLGGSLEVLDGEKRCAYRLTMPIPDNESDESMVHKDEHAGIPLYPDIESYLEIIMGKNRPSNFSQTDNAFSGPDLKNQEAVSFFGYSKAPLEPVKRAPLRTVLEKTIRTLASEGTRRFIVTLEDEFQVIAGETLLALRKECALECVVMIPYRYGYFIGIRWSENLVDRAWAIIRQADAVSYLTDKLPAPTEKAWSRYNILQWFRLKHICPLCKAMVTYCKSRFDDVLISVIDCININLECENVPIEKPEIPRNSQTSTISFFKELGKRKTAGFLYSWNPRFQNLENENEAIQAILKRQLLKCIQEDGIENFLVILENPFQIIAGEIVLSLQKEFPHIALFAVMTKNIGDFYLRKWGYAFAGRMAAILEAAQFRCWFCSEANFSENDTTRLRSAFLPYYHTLIHSTYPGKPVTDEYHAAFPNLKQVLLHKALEGYILEIEKRLRINAIIQYFTAVNISMPISKKKLLQMPYAEISSLLNQCFPVASGSVWLPETEDQIPKRRKRLNPDEQEGYKILCKIYELLGKLNRPQ